MTDRSFAALVSRLREAGRFGPAPVERWDPPFCGDVDLRIDREGRWFYQGSPIGRPALVALFASVLRRDAEGRTYLVTPVEKVAITVEDAPFLAVAVEQVAGRVGPALRFTTQLGESVVAGPDHPVRFGADPDGGFKVYVHVRGRLEALASRSLVHDLVELAEERDGRLALVSDGVVFPLPEAGT